LDKQEHIARNEVDVGLSTRTQVLSATILVEGVDYSLDESGSFVLTAKYLLERGSCCHRGCKHCPYTTTG